MNRYGLTLIPTLIMMLLETTVLLKEYKRAPQLYLPSIIISGLILFGNKYGSIFN